METCPGVIKKVKLDPMVPVTWYYLPVFRDFSSFFIFFSPPKNTISSQIFLGLFSIKQDTFLILKLLITFLKELVVGFKSHFWLNVLAY